MSNQQGQHPFLQGPPKRPEISAQRKQAASKQSAEDLAQIGKIFPSVMGHKDTNTAPKMNVEQDFQEEAEPLSWGGPEEPMQAPQPIQTEQPRAPQPGTRPRPPFQPVQQPTMTHPVLDQLRQAFGLDEAPVYEIDVEGMRFVLQLLNTDRLALAMRLGEFKSQSPAEYGVKIKRGIVAASTISIGGAKIEDIFQAPTRRNGVLLNEDERRALAIEEYFNLLTSGQGKWVMLGDRLYQEYQEHLDPQSSISTSVDGDAANKTNYHCPVEGCEVGRKELPGTYYCHIHGQQLIGTSDLESESDIPLD